MGLPGFQIIGIVALVFTLLSTTLQLLSFFYPVWWYYSNPSSSKLNEVKVGMVNSVECRAGSCNIKSLIHIEGEVEWLFISRIFEVFACFLCVLALLMHVIYLPSKRENVRSVAIYMLGAAGLFGLGGAFVFAALYSNLGKKLDDGDSAITFAFPICIVTGFLHIAASVVTAVATVKGARHQYTDEEESYIV